MIYYMKIDKNMKNLKINSVKNIHNLSRELKMSWGSLNDYLNGTDSEIVKLDCGVRMPLIKKNGKEMYLISYYEEIIKDRNYNYMSMDVMKELDFRNEYGNVYNTLKKVVI